MWIIFKNHFRPELTVLVDMDKVDFVVGCNEKENPGGTVITFSSGLSVCVTDTPDQIIKAIGPAGGTERNHQN